MEGFIENIYRDCDIIEYIKEYISLTNSGCYRDARSFYDKAAAGLESILLRLSEEDGQRASQIQDIALKIKDSFNDHCLSTGIAEGRLLPELYSLISCYTGIKVSEDKYILESSDTGYLTIKDTDIDLYYHDIHDPMWEAREMAQSLLTPKTDAILIFGCGLGYLPYQLWFQSEAAVKITIYEDDPLILQYAYNYGVLSLIPESDVTVINKTDKNLLADIFIQDIQMMSDSASFVFSRWKKLLYKDIGNNELRRLIINRELNIEMSFRSTSNLCRNMKSFAIPFDEFTETFDYDEWVVISAGPSFDSCVPFIHDSKGKRGLIAVNTVLRRLSKEGIIPDLCVAADQYVQMIDHILGIEDYTVNIPLVADWTLNWKYAAAYKGTKCFVRTNASAALTEDIIPKEPVWDISGTVACMAVEAAIRLGAKKIYLVGQDLAYPGGQRYAKDMPHQQASDIGYDLLVLSVDGDMVGTCEAFDWFRKALEYQIGKYDHVVFINLSQHGAYIKGTHRADNLI